MSQLSDKIGGFATIPNTVVKMIPAIGAEAFTLWSYLRYRTNAETEVAFPSYDTIRKDLGDQFHSRKVAECIRTLEAHKLMERQKRFGNSTKYSLICPVLSTVKAESFQRVKTNKTDINKKLSLSKGEPPKSETPEPKTPKQAAYETLEKGFSKFGGFVPPALIERFYATFDGNPDHPTERLANAVKKLEETRSFFKAIDAYREWTPPKPQSSYQRAKPGIARAPAAPKEYDKQASLRQWVQERIANGMDVPKHLQHLVGGAP